MALCNGEPTLLQVHYSHKNIACGARCDCSLGGDLRDALEHGNHQDREVMGIEVDAKDAARFEGGWALFQFDSKKTGKKGTLSKRYRP